MKSALESLQSDMVKALWKPGAQLHMEVTADKLELNHAVIGISGEAGELLDAVKKHTIYNKPLDLDNVIEELGDLEFFMEALRQTLGIEREETLEANQVKLSKRYADKKYSNEAAAKRADKAV